MTIRQKLPAIIWNRANDKKLLASICVHIYIAQFIFVNLKSIYFTVRDLKQKGVLLRTNLASLPVLYATITIFVYSVIVSIF